MSRTVYVTRAQKAAAQWLVDYHTAQGQPVDRATRLIAEAKPAPRPEVTPEAPTVELRTSAG